MNVEDFDYYLPEELIAQTPLSNRSESRLLIVDRNNNNLEHKHFYNIIDELGPNDCLVLNNTKVYPSRIYGNKIDTNAFIEVLLLKDLGNNIWECLTKPARRVKVGTIISFNDGLLKTKCIKELDDGMRHFEMIYDGIFLEILEKIGTMPLPPYIHEKLKDQSRYQTVYAKDYGSAAAPTAGLHFTKELLDELKNKGVQIEYVTLNVGLGTFRPVSVEKIEDHIMHTEKYHMDKSVAERLNEAIKNNKRIVAVGTTSIRTLESIYTKYNTFKECTEDTNIFIYPGYNWKVVDALITNFHLPKSTLIMLVSSFAGKDLIMKAYSEAVKEKYRFFSFGDAMFIK